MQVASLPLMAGSFSRAQSLTLLSASSVSVSIASAPGQKLKVGEATTVSNAARMALEVVARSSKLSRDDKKTLTWLIASVDEFAGGDAKLMGKIILLAKLMEAQDKPTPLKYNWRQVLKDYLDDRNQLHGNDAVNISAETEINIVRFQYLGIEVSGASSGDTANKNPSNS